MPVSHISGTNLPTYQVTKWVHVKLGLTWVTARVSRRVKSPPQTASSSSSLSRGAETSTVLAAGEALSTATALALQLRSNSTRGATHTHNTATGTPLPAQKQLIVRSNTPDADGNNQHGSEASHSASQLTGKKKGEERKSGRIARQLFRLCSGLVLCPREAKGGRETRPQHAGLAWLADSSANPFQCY